MILSYQKLLKTLALLEAQKMQATKVAAPCTMSIEETQDALTHSLHDRTWSS